MTRIAGSTILITGGAGGLGRLMALKMAGLGGNLVLWDIHPDRLAEVVAELEAATGRRAHGYLCDVADRRSVYAMAAIVKRDVGPVDVLVNNAGVVCGTHFWNSPDEHICRTMDVNATGMFWTCKAFLPEMIESGSGHVVTIAAAAGLLGIARLAAFSASKAAAVGFDEALRAELRGRASGVTTTVVCPYFVDNGTFRGVKTRRSWLLPMLREDWVAERIVRAIRRNRRRLVMPRLMHFLPLLRLLPVGLFDAAVGMLGVHRSMDEFVGRAEDRGPGGR